MKVPGDYAQVKFRPGTRGPLIESLKSRSTELSDRAFSETAKCDLTDYYELLPLCLPEFSEEEWMILSQALNGWEATPKTAHTLWAEVYDFSEQMGIEQSELIARLRKLTTFECWAIYNAINNKLPDEQDA